MTFGHIDRLEFSWERATVPTNNARVLIISSTRRTDLCQRQEFCCHRAPVVYFQFCEHLLDVIVGRIQAKRELVRDLAIAHTLRKEKGRLALLRRKRRVSSAPKKR